MSLTIHHFSARRENKTILKDVTLAIESGTIHVLMGPNGSGKSTLAQTLMGHPLYAVGEKSKVLLNGKNIHTLEPHERARAGLFLAFQTPIAIPGVTVANFLRHAYQAVHGKKGKPISLPDFNVKLVETAATLSIPKEFLGRTLNEEFSGGEKKKLEMLQALILSPRFAIFDEIDTGLDVDALKIVSSGIMTLKKNGAGIFLITHYQRILHYVIPDVVSILINGSIVETGDAHLAAYIEKHGYAKWKLRSDS